MKTIIKIIIAVVCIGVVVGVGVVVVNNVTDSPRKTIERFEEAYNNVDVQGMVDCCDSTTRGLYEGANTLAGELIGIDINTFVDSIPFLAAIDDDIDMDDAPKIHIDIKSIKKDGDTAIVECEIELDGQTEDEISQIPMVKEAGEWYIDCSDALSDLF